MKKIYIILLTIVIIIGSAYVVNKNNIEQEIKKFELLGFTVHSVDTGGFLFKEQFINSFDEPDEKDIIKLDKNTSYEVVGEDLKPYVDVYVNTKEGIKISELEYYGYTYIDSIKHYYFRKIIGRKKRYLSIEKTDVVKLVQVYKKEQN
ncbi:MAG: hypothetical protein N4A57_13405 [Anaeromicrobium sp.]|uniref:hypothetical protein n=1 Tax=Anaeromicrobium sp. TaxID=1929132 RepID=UPI0025F5FB75|nr:hypothetical protein [Anaeromicrobium sp.]MCT4595240.1 hypothetical protein [Anaeromicrobium sp.]